MKQQKMEEKVRGVARVAAAFFFAFLLVMNVLRARGDFIEPSLSSLSFVSPPFNMSIADQSKKSGSDIDGSIGAEDFYISKIDRWLSEGPIMQIKEATGYGNSPLWVAGQLGGALQFDGVGNYVYIGRQIPFFAQPNIFSPPSPLTISAWVKTASDGGIFGTDIIVTNNIGNTQNYVGLRISGGRLNGLTDVSGAWPSYDVVGTRNVADDVWHHVVFTADPVTGNLALYVDGALDGQATVADIVPFTTGAFFAQTGMWWARQYLAATIDDVRLYNRLMTPAEIAANQFPSNRIAHWPIDDGSGFTVRDVAGSSYQGGLNPISTTLAVAYCDPAYQLMGCSFSRQPNLLDNCGNEGECGTIGVVPVDEYGDWQPDPIIDDFSFSLLVGCKALIDPEFTPISNEVVAVHAYCMRKF